MIPFHWQGEPRGKGDDDDDDDDDDEIEDAKIRAENGKLFK